ncbi:serologically defined colon cancer antigen 8 homolog isoform X2 [Anthonomus grandis grandis]|uniref:serologically defined colon cancer antigen 8 homolog isoform X2 n=1 Tax=Anthonomus grandis grandis TaxID=2921223 RepID=UPI00216618BB|nr:serologically defined colon cancer antigen 8 homolog isoform X2 [Anthonomus grandis grandis]
MFSTTGSTTLKKQRPSTSYLVRPKLGAVKSLYSNRPLSALSNEKRKKSRKSTTQPKMDIRRKPDYADTAYREAVGRLRILMAESYIPTRRIYGSSRPIRELDSAGEETDNQSILSGASRTSRRPHYNYSFNPITPKKYYYPPLKSNVGTLRSESVVEKSLPHQEPSKVELHPTAAPPELMSFIERQEDYIEQLEKESRFCRDELSSLLSKVKDVISENENLHERQKSKLIKSVFEHLETETETETDLELGDKHKSPKKIKKTRIMDGPAIVFESRISELEAQLTQAKIDLKKAQEENEQLRKKMSEGTLLEGNSYENFKRQLDNCNREKEELLTKLKALQSALATLRNKENDTCDQVKRSLDVAEQAQYEKNAAELEIRRLKDELERQHMKLRDTIADQSRRVSDERSAVERRYSQQIEQLTAEVGVQWETTNKLQLELDKQRRENADLRRECTQKQALIDELKKDMQTKILTLQSDIGVTGAEKSALEQQISSLNMANERTERQYKQEITRLQAEIQSLRQRMDRADADLIHSRRENIRLNEQVAALEKEINLNTALNEERTKSVTPRSGEIMALPPPTPKKEERDKELGSLLQDMENRHAATVAELENMIHSQNQLMDKLSSECHALTRKLEDSSHKHKEEIRELQTSLDRLNNRFSQTQYSTMNLPEDQHATNTQRTLPASQATPTASFQEPQNLKKSESKSSIKMRSRMSSRQASQEQLPLTLSTTAAPTQQYSSQYQEEPIEQQYPQQSNEGNQPQYDSNTPYAPEQYHPEYISEPGQSYDTSDPNQQYDDSQYQYDPNVQYDQQYDLNQQYDPNQSYVDEGQYIQDQNQYYADQGQSYSQPQNAPLTAPISKSQTNVDTSRRASEVESPNKT